MTPQQLAEIHAACFTHPRPWSAEEFSDLLSAEKSHLLTSPNGFAVIQIAGPEAELLTIAVHPSVQRSGEGRTLLAQSLSAAVSQGCEEMFLEVANTNVAAIALYTASGFSERAIRKDYYNGLNGQKISALVMHKTL